MAEMPKPPDSEAAHRVYTVMIRKFGHTPFKSFMWVLAMEGHWMICWKKDRVTISLPLSERGGF